MANIKLPLQTRDKDGRRHGLPWSSCLPFVENSRGILIHRPRSVATHKIGGKWPAHIAIGFWCGMTASGGKNFTFLSAPPENALLCPRCEAAAVASGLPGADELAGRHVHRGRVIGVKVCCDEKTADKP